ncbi:MAG TPA: MBL fold metallo-hydrolase [Gemmatimonadaceae bacterium]|nr:MBL fold metallo-hydrolase [Gemmatimonadaceae bacterium]
MLLRRFYDDTLAQASYLIGCQRTGDAIVVDPNRDAEQYLAAARSEGVRISHVTETHIHADFVSGARELARRADAQLLLSDCGAPAWRYAFASEGATLLRDCDTISVGNVRLEVMHTPGHTPEHIAFVVTDTAGADQPMGILSGDFVFVGDVGRPDLLERAAHVAGSTDALARKLFQSLRRARCLPDWLQLWPGHGAGSACGKALGAVPQSTLGYERRFNWAFQIDDEETFVREVLAGQSDPPPYFARMKRLNQRGPRILGGFPEPVEIDEIGLREAMRVGAPIIDTRPTAAFAEGHLRGALSIPAGKSFLTWAGWLVDGERELHLIADDARAAKAAMRALAMIGVDRVISFATPASMRAAAGAGALQKVERLSASELRTRIEQGGVHVVDVRNASEWQAGHLPGVPNIPLGRLASHIGELPRDRIIVAQCQSGMRSMIASSILQARGVPRVMDLRGGFEAWTADGLPVERAGRLANASAPA